jgi:nucleoside-diphosphate-sugar epimerase
MLHPPEGVEVAKVDITDFDAAERAVRGAEAVYLCAQPPLHLWDSHFPALQDGAIDAAAMTGAKLIVADNLFGYGPATQEMTEDLPLTTHTLKGRVRARMSQDLMQAHKRGVVRVAVARGSDLFGPWVSDSAVGARTFKAILAGRPAGVIGDPDAQHSYTFVQDFGEVLATLGTDDRSLGQIWHVPNAPAVSTREFLQRAYRLAGTKPAMLKLSKTQLRIAGLFVPALKEAVEMLYEFEQPFVVDHSKFVNTFGDISRPLDVSLSQTLEWARSL